MCNTVNQTSLGMMKATREREQSFRSELLCNEANKIRNSLYYALGSIDFLNKDDSPFRSEDLSQAKIKVEEALFRLEKVR